MRTLWYFLFKLFLKTGLFFYTKKIKVSGKENIPKKGAVLFAVNHPNGLIDPLLVTTNISRVNHFLVRAAVFKKPLVKWFLGTLNLMPIYRIRDGASNLGKNKAIFEDCFNIFKNGKTLMIFPEGSHDSKRTVRTLSKGFTRIVFGAIEKYPEIKITIIPVGITYQNAAAYPSKVAINFGKPILANSFLHKDNLPVAAIKLKNEVSYQLKQLCVHLKNDDNYNTKLKHLNKAQIDFTEVQKINKFIEEDIFLIEKKPQKNNYKWLLLLIKINFFVPFLIWKVVSKKIDEFEFIDTFRFGINAITFPIFLLIQGHVIKLFFGNIVGISYLAISILLVLLYTKLAPTNTKNN
ncbi:lysophospholipid acyltransferase family protein [uncultured Polaribacter sp.]|uniref:lysophospholipid acyltransferase family protein n=1 Tax=uncultured Polaribacter sp. TaxID=174711 RepID=UPI002626051C|nr:lysophospholipid acyltransferase family protein [uncultured Polaribacter sp.]